MSVASFGPQRILSIPLVFQQSYLVFLLLEMAIIRNLQTKLFSRLGLVSTFKSKKHGLNVACSSKFLFRTVKSNLNEEPALSSFLFSLNH